MVGRVPGAVESREVGLERLPPRHGKVLLLVEQVQLVAVMQTDRDFQT
jgi:hypothetical protein